jgi:hypothetical protein
MPRAPLSPPLSCLCFNIAFVVAGLQTGSWAPLAPVIPTEVEGSWPHSRLAWLTGTRTQPIPPGLLPFGLVTPCVRMSLLYRPLRIQSSPDLSSIPSHTTSYRFRTNRLRPILLPIYQFRAVPKKQGGGYPLSSFVTQASHPGNLSLPSLPPYFVASLLRCPLASFLLSRAKIPTP